MGSMGETGLDVRHLLSGPYALAQAEMGGMDRASSRGMPGGAELRLPERSPQVASDSGMGMRPMPPGGAMVPTGDAMSAARSSTLSPASSPRPGLSFVPLASSRR